MTWSVSLPDSVTSSRIKITGVCPAAQPHALAELLRRHPAPIWLVVHEEAQQADSIAEDIALFHAANANPTGLEILHFPEAQTDHREMREAFNAASDRLSVLSKLRGLRSVGDRVPSPGEDTTAIMRIVWIMELVRGPLSLSSGLGRAEPRKPSGFRQCVWQTVETVFPLVALPHPAKAGC